MFESNLLYIAHTHWCCSLPTAHHLKVTKQIYVLISLALGYIGKVRLKDWCEVNFTTSLRDHYGLLWRLSLIEQTAKLSEIKVIEESRERLKIGLRKRNNPKKQNTNCRLYMPHPASCFATRSFTLQILYDSWASNLTHLPIRLRI